MSGEVVCSCAAEACAPAADDRSMADAFRKYLRKRIGAPRYRTQFIVDGKITDNNQPWSTLSAFTTTLANLDIQMVVPSCVAEGRKELKRAIKQGNIEMVKSVMESFADPNMSIDIVESMDPDDMNIMNIDTQEIDLQPVQPLQLAVCLKEYSITKVLLKAAANVNNTNSSPPALNIACYNHDLRMMQLLLRRTADPNHRNKLGYTTLHACVLRGAASATALLLRCRADMAAECCCDGLTPLGVAIQWSISSAAKLLLAHRAIVHEARASHSALHVAAEQGNTTFMRILVEAKADPNATNRHGESPADVLPKRSTFRERHVCRRLLSQQL